MGISNHCKSLKVQEKKSHQKEQFATKWFYHSFQNIEYIQPAFLCVTAIKNISQKCNSSALKKYAGMLLSLKQIKQKEKDIAQFPYGHAKHFFGIAIFVFEYCLLSPA